MSCKRGRIGKESIERLLRFLNELEVQLLAPVSHESLYHLAEALAVLYGTGGGVENLPTKEVLYASQAPGLIAGAWQLNVRIPEFASKGEVVWRAGERESVEGVHVALQD
jgi:uncharacterized protein (TIGR03437 family)